MGRKPLIRSNFFPYHVVNRCNNLEWFKLPLEVVWDVMTAELYRISILYEAQIHAFVLMTNHYHLILSTPKDDLGVIMREFGANVTRTINLISGQRGHLFGGPYKWSQIRSPSYYANALKYVYRNPVKAGMTKRVEDYPFSTLSGMLGHRHLPFPLFIPRPEEFGISFLPQSTDELVGWFNQPFEHEIDEAMKLGLRRKVFQLPRDKKTGKVVVLESPLLTD